MQISEIYLPFIIKNKKVDEAKACFIDDKQKPSMSKHEDEQSQPYQEVYLPLIQTHNVMINYCSHDENRIFLGPLQKRVCKYNMKAAIERTSLDSECGQRNKTKVDKKLRQHFNHHVEKPFKMLDFHKHVHSYSFKQK